MVNIRRKKVIVIMFLGSMVIGIAVFTGGSTLTRVSAQTVTTSTAPTTIGAPGSTAATLQEIFNGLQAVVSEAQASPSSLTPAEEAELIQAITVFQGIIAEMVPNTVATPFH